MDTVGQIGTELQKLLENAGLGAVDPLALWSLGVGLLALLLAVRAGRRSGGAQIARVQEKVEHLDVRLADLQNELGRIREALQKGGQPLPPRAEEAKKKSEPLTAVTAPVTAPVTPSAEPAAPQKSFFSGLKKTREQFLSKISALLGSTTQIDAATHQELEELLITSDMGVRTAHKLLDRLTESLKTAREKNEQVDLRATLQQGIFEILRSDTPPEITPRGPNGQPLIVLVVGVNGVGKTTTIGKLAARFKAQGAKVLVAACDTFRAAAVEQMQAWGRRAGVEVVAGDENAKPSTVAYQAVHRAQDEGYDVLLVDTAGRLHTRVNLMNELVNVVRIIEREQPGSPQESILVLDASTGQNALQQAREFHEKVQLSGIVITKLDGTPKGGIVVAIKDELGIPIRYIGVGEGVDDLKPFSAEDFTEALFAEEDSVQQESGLRVVRRRERATF